jgi:hypothetical protein
MQTKLCRLCNTQKPITSFSSDKKAKDGHTIYCHECKYQKYGKSYYDKNRKYLNEIKAKWRRNFAKTHRKIVTAYQKKFEDLHPDFKLTRDLIREHKLPIGAECERCHSQENLVRHHPDYKQPYLTITLCRTCHFKIHGKLKKTAN